MSAEGDTKLTLASLLDGTLSQYSNRIKHPAAQWVLLIFGVAALVAAAWLIADASRNSAQAEGVVVSVRPPASDHYPLIEYGLPDGSTIRFRLAEGQFHAHWSVGQRVAVYYDPSEPGHATVYSPSRSILGPLLLTVAGAACLLGFAAGLRRRLRARHDS
jgi:hypothetical protein